ncbi:MAG TPA: hypothetical protein VF548_16735 [Allosphingosinicella sp.]|jgi:hypothetical protein
MSWTDQPESERRCHDSPGAVSSTETVARITVRPLEPDGYVPFLRKDFFPPGKDFDNECGDSDGCSVERLGKLSAADIVAKSQARADQANARRTSKGKPANRAADGARTALVGTLRSIRLEDRPEEQILFVYDDGGEKNPDHAILRASPALTPEEGAALLLKVNNSFKGHIP